MLTRNFHQPNAFRIFIHRGKHGNSMWFARNFTELHAACRQVYNEFCSYYEIECTQDENEWGELYAKAKAGDRDALVELVLGRGECGYEYEDVELVELGVAPVGEGNFEQSAD